MPRPSVHPLVMCCLALIAVSPLAGTQKPGVVTLVPAAPWRMIQQEKLNPSALARWGGDPAIAQEYGVQSVEHRVYALQGSSAQVDVVVAASRDPSEAYGLYTFCRTESMAPVPGMELAVEGPQQALIARGHYLILVPRPRTAPSKPAQTAPGRSGTQTPVVAPSESLAVSTNDFRALLILVAGIRPSANALAALPTPLPAAGLVSASEKYLLGKKAASHVLPDFPVDLLGFEQGAEVQVATYETRSHARARVLAISYPDPQIARQRFQGMESGALLNQDRGAQSIYGQRRGSYIFLTTEAPSKAVADTFLNEFSVTHYISWNERYLGNQPVAAQMLRLIISNLLLVMLLIGFAVGGGLLIVLSKRLSRKFFPRLEWGHQDSGSFIILNLK